MSKRHWQPGIPVRYVERDGAKVMQQVWLLYEMSSTKRWNQTGEWEWRDVPLQQDDAGDPASWTREV